MAYNLGQQQFDVEDDRLCCLVSLDYYDEEDWDGIPREGPPPNVLRAAYYEREMGACKHSHCTDSLALMGSASQQATGSRK